MQEYEYINNKFVELLETLTEPMEFAEVEIFCCNLPNSYKTDILHGVIADNNHKCKIGFDMERGLLLYPISDKLIIPIINKSGLPNPKYAYEGDSGFDFTFNADLLEATKVSRKWLLKPLNRLFIPTGLYFDLPVNVEMQIRGRSSLTKKHGLIVPLGTVDSKYKGEIGITIINCSNHDYTINHGDRIAQGVLNTVGQAEFKNVKTIGVSERGAGGFGSTGK